MNGIGLALAPHFLRPWCWLALVPLPLTLWVLARGGGGRAALAQLADAVLLPYLVRDAGRRGRAALALFALAWVLAVATLAGPAWQKVATPLYVNGAARVVVLSLSDDMLAQDLKPDRLTRARFAVRDLLAAAGDARTALVAYAGAAFTVAPLTDDKRTVLNLLQALQPDVMPVPGNDAAAGIRQGVRLLQQAAVHGGGIVLVTDTAGAAAITAARGARAHGIRIDVLGIGSATGAPVPQPGGGFLRGADGLVMARRDDAALRAVAAAGGGQYAVLQADGSGVARLPAPVATQGHASGSQHAPLWRDGGIWLLPVLVIVAALAFRRGWLLVLCVLVLPVSAPMAHASTWSDFWANADQRAVAALQRGDAARAQRLATTPAVRGAADYRTGDYGAAASAFAQGHDARARYNLGNALAKQGDYAKAIAAYRSALQRDPQMADARANLDAIEAWLKRHQPPGHPRGNSGTRSSGGQHQQESHDGSGGESGHDLGEHQPAPPQGSASAQSPPSRSGANGRPESDSAAKPAPGPGTGADTERRAASPAEAARQDREAKQAGQDLARELQRAAGQPSQPKSSAGPQTFALGQSEPAQDDRFDASQRALLRSVPDDPGALLRRKFRLEWEQRQGKPATADGQ